MGGEDLGGTHAGAVSDVAFARGGDGGPPLTLEQVFRFAACDALEAAATLRKMAMSVGSSGGAAATTRSGFGKVELEDLGNRLEAPLRLVRALGELSAAGGGLEQSLREGVHRSMAEQLDEDERIALKGLREALGEREG